MHISTNPNNIQEEEGLSKALRKLLKKANIPTFKRLAKFKRYTLLKKIPDLKVRHLVALECELERRRLSFVEDGTIIVDGEISQRRLFNLWKLGIRRYCDFNKMHYWKIIEVLGGQRSFVFAQKGTLGWMKKHIIVPSEDHAFYTAGFTKETRDSLMSAGIETFEQLLKISDGDLALALTGRKWGPDEKKYNRATRWNQITKTRIREINYVLWKHGYERPCCPL